MNLGAPRAGFAHEVFDFVFVDFALAGNLTGQSSPTLAIYLERHRLDSTNGVLRLQLFQPFQSEFTLPAAHFPFLLPHAIFHFKGRIHVRK